MSGFLLDSNVVVWLDQNPARIPVGVRAQLASDPDVWLSAVSAWELGIKQTQGSLKLNQPVSALLEALQLRELPVTIRHGEAVQTLPLIHRDPFDRILVAQAMVEGLTLVTSDRKLAEYGVPVLLV